MQKQKSILPAPPPKRTVQTATESPFQAQTCSLGCRKLTGCRLCTCWSRRQCIRHGRCWGSRPDMLEGGARRRRGKRRAWIQGGWRDLGLCWVQLRRHGTGRIRGDVHRRRVNIRGGSRRGERLLGLIERRSPRSERILLCWLTSYTGGGKKENWY